jgi:hypothetical protein
MTEPRHWPAALIGSAAALALLAGCVGHRPLAGGDPLVVTEETAGEPAADAERAAAVAEMRALADMATKGPPPQVPQVARIAQLAARPEPKSAAEVAAIEAELTLIAERQAASADPQEIAALEARAKELEQLAAAAGAGPLRR